MLINRVTQILSKSLSTTSCLRRFFNHKQKKTTLNRNCWSQLIKCAIISSWLAIRAVSLSIQLLSGSLRTFTTQNICALTIPRVSSKNMACNGFKHDDDDHDNFHHYSDLECEDEQRDKYEKCSKKNCIVKSVRYFFCILCFDQFFLKWVF